MSVFDILFPICIKKGALLVHRRIRRAKPELIRREAAIHYTRMPTEISRGRKDEKISGWVWNKLLDTLDRLFGYDRYEKWHSQSLQSSAYRDEIWEKYVKQVGDVWKGLFIPSISLIQYEAGGIVFDWDYIPKRKFLNSGAKWHGGKGSWMTLQSLQHLCFPS